MNPKIMIFRIIFAKKAEKWPIYGVFRGDSDKETRQKRTLFCPLPVHIYRREMMTTELPTDRALVVPDAANQARDKRVVKSGFWPKIRTTIGKVPFVEDAVAAYFCATDRQTPTYVRAILFAALAYFVMPVDLIPDFIAGLGFTDDATVLMAAFSAVRSYLTDDHRSKARAYLERVEPSDC